MASKTTKKEIQRRFTGFLQNLEKDFQMIVKSTCVRLNIKPGLDAGDLNPIIIKARQELQSKETFTEFLSSIVSFMDEEYRSIPEKERVGKGKIYIAKSIGGSFYSFIAFLDKSTRLVVLWSMLKMAEQSKTMDLINLAMVTVAKFMIEEPEFAGNLVPLVERCATSKNWEAREISIYPVSRLLEKCPEIAIPLIKNWAKD
ncbi:MAG: hypothetical protein ACTSRA_18970, partial [Promethearchaeota archaeon]